MSHYGVMTVMALKEDTTTGQGKARPIAITEDRHNCTGYMRNEESLEGTSLHIPTQCNTRTALLPPWRRGNDSVSSVKPSIESA